MPTRLCRPPNSLEKRSDFIKAVEVAPDKKEIRVHDRVVPEQIASKLFVFDKVFGPDEKQIDVYRAVMEPTIAEVMMGYNCTVFAPPNSLEKRSDFIKAVEVAPDKKEIRVHDRVVPEQIASKLFVFDKVFGPDEKQIDVYRAVMEPTIAEVMMGYNCTVFAYGQTGTVHIRETTADGEELLKTGKLNLVTSTSHSLRWVVS
ncbi:hypothetical protein HPB49_000785 [Dermacentor silvarum]|uniref:Uncharacterized protein n=1 Tax=Dermacentor silvarum TaxID=543639 RepID=A0ACB8DSN7_DERSI|nr:hypothetical protein HPB49_000785 [Dermacentor silvarum]